MKYSINIDPRLKIPEPEKHWEFPVALTFSGDFTEENCRKFIEEFKAAEDHAVKSKQGVLPIVIDSYGGDVYALLGMVDIIKNCPLPVATIVEGKAMSCGAVLFSCGTEGYRFIGHCGTVMLHEVSSFSFGKNEDIKATAKETDRLNTFLFKLMARNVGKPEHYFIDLLHQNKNIDLFLDSDDCLKHNLANKVGIPSFNIAVEMKIDFKHSG
jgi:ATP-dependent protease ClpP protease subunit